MKAGQQEGDLVVTRGATQLEDVRNINIYISEDVCLNCLKDSGRLLSSDLANSCLISYSSLGMLLVSFPCRAYIILSVKFLKKQAQLIVLASSFAPGTKND